jgi:hypothetical protein
MRFRQPLIRIIILALLFAFLFSGCSRNGQITPASTEPDEAQPEKAEEITQPDPVSTAAPDSLLLVESVFSSESPFCVPEISESAFSTICSGVTLAVSQNENRRHIEILMRREIPVKFSGPFAIEAEILTETSEGENLDQNQYGLVMVDGKGNRHVLRVQGKYFNWETWAIDGKLKTTSRLNLSYSPNILPSGQINHFRLVCSTENCDLFINGEFTARLPNEMPWGLYALGIFTASDWDEQFGSVKFLNFLAAAHEQEEGSSESIRISDDLTMDSGIFSQMGLSGAFNSFEADGFHFSPVIPYGYYAAKANPSFADVSVSVVVDMDINPDKSSSQYGGLICRSSLEGMYMAVVRADGTYSIFRDTPQRQFALLAERTSEHIRAGAAKNDLRMDCIGEQINFYINGNQVESLTDSRYGLRFGRVGLYTKAGGSPAPDAIIFRDLFIEEIR